MLPQYSLKFKKRRNLDILASETFVVATYTLDSAYVPTYELTGVPSATCKVLPGATVLALDPVTHKAVPNYTSYGFQALGVSLEDAYCGYGATVFDTVVDVVWRGDVREDRTWDDGVLGTVLQATKEALADRIQFVKVGAGAKDFT
jgi:hypothetical protein